MKKPKKLTAKEVMESSEGEFFIDRLAHILLAQIEQESIAKTTQNQNETGGVRQSQ